MKLKKEETAVVAGSNFNMRTELVYISFYFKSSLLTACRQNRLSREVETIEACPDEKASYDPSGVETVRWRGKWTSG